LKILRIERRDEKRREGGGETKRGKKRRRKALGIGIILFREVIK
jgi:hypothetical protein